MVKIQNFLQAKVAVAAGALLTTLVGATSHAQTLSGTPELGPRGAGLAGSGLTQVAASCDLSTTFAYQDGIGAQFIPTLPNSPTGASDIVTCGVDNGDTVAAGDAFERFGGTISGLTVGDDYEFQLYIAGDQYNSNTSSGSGYFYGTRCFELGFEVGTVKVAGSTVQDGQWQSLVVPFTATATTMNFESHGTGNFGPAARNNIRNGWATTASGCNGAWSFNATAVSLAVAAPDADGDGDPDTSDPAPNDPCTDSSGTNTSAYALANCANLSAAKSGGTSQGSCAAGQVEWTLTATNSGPATAIDVLVNDYPIAGITGVVSATSTNCSALPCTIATLASGASEVITICTN